MAKDQNPPVEDQGNDGATPPASEICATNIACWTQPAYCDNTVIGETGWYTCGHTLATVCTQLECHTGAQPQVAGDGSDIKTWFQTCGVPPATLPQNCHQGTLQTWFQGCGVPPVTYTCPNGAAPQVAGVGINTYGQGCGVPPVTIYGCQTQIGCQPQTIQTWFQGCGVPPVTADCTQGASPQVNVGPTGWYTCGQQQQTCGDNTRIVATTYTQIGCTGYQGCHNTATTTVQPSTHLDGCTTVTSSPEAVTTTVQTLGGGNCHQTQLLGCTGWYTCHQPATCGSNTKIVATTYTQLGCITQNGCPQPTTYTQIGCTGYQGCNTATTTVQTQNSPQVRTMATVCTQIGCQTNYPGCTTATAQSHCYGCDVTHISLATTCSQIGCTLNGCPQPTTYTQIGCTGYHGCNTATTTVQTQNCPQVAGNTQLLGCTTETAQTRCYGCGATENTIATVCTLEPSCRNTATTTVQTNFPGCTTATSQTRCYGCNGPQVRTLATVCTQDDSCRNTATTTVQTNVPGCTTATSQTRCYGCNEGGHTLATVCTQFGCPNVGRPQTVATVCTEFGCTQVGCPQVGGGASALGCTTATSETRCYGCYTTYTQVNCNQGGTGLGCTTATSQTRCYGCVVTNNTVGEICCG